MYIKCTLYFFRKMQRRQSVQHQPRFCELLMCALCSVVRVGGPLWNKGAACAPEHCSGGGSCTYVHACILHRCWNTPKEIRCPQTEKYPSSFYDYLQLQQHSSICCTVLYKACSTMHHHFHLRTGGCHDHSQASPTAQLKNVVG